MKKTVIKNIRGIGPVKFVKSTRAKRINISIRVNDAVRVAVPRGVSFLRAEALVNTKQDWIKKHLKNLEYSNTILERPNQKNNQKIKLELISRLGYLAGKYGFKYNRVSIRNQKTRWGSCSSNNNINLNIRLIKLPPELMDYVILHELVHTRIKNHSRKFWDELDYYVGNAKQLDKQLKQYKISNQTESDHEYA